MSKARRATSPMPMEPRLRRAYFDCRYGQLHMRYAIPAGGGFDEATTLLCIPGTPGSGRFFAPLLLPLGRDRSVYAPDLPGCGESDGATEPLSSGALAQALGDFLDSMHVRHVDLLAHEGGVAIATAMLQQRPAQIGRIVLSPDTDTVRAESRALRHPSLVIDLRPPDERGGSAAELEGQAVLLREFLGLA
ncbi:MAG TPA: alpha/beta fold hydrolase [Steroidobacteraceae bacterium]